MPRIDLKAPEIGLDGRDRLEFGTVRLLLEVALARASSISPPDWAVAIDNW